MGGYVNSDNPLGTRDAPLNHFGFWKTSEHIEALHMCSKLSPWDTPKHSKRWGVSL